ncbi:hypothetical protein Tcan_03433 [Toxocara canis]|uniref:Secreted protein n=1 Tax=Toxocara canis TaxID=6265 RepID=A0A0B2VTQ6_TOXCA|nr:hypothetical protein Tcan_03433 [Toxocara canis]
MDFFVLLTWVFFTHQAVARSSNGVSEKLPENVPQLFTLNLDKNLKEALEGLTRVEGPLSIDLSGFITNGKSFNASFKVKIEGKASIDYAIESNTVKTTSTPTTKRAAATTAMGMATATATADDARLQKLVDDMRSADVDKPTDYKLDWGGPVNGLIGDWSTFRDELWKLWFGAYSRCKGNGALGSSAFDFTIFTVCTLRNPNSKRCRYLLDGYPQAVATFLKPCGENGQEKCISTTYPTQWN